MNPTPPPAPASRSLNVVDPLAPALGHVKRMLFQPFDLGKWFVIGFGAWLAGLGERQGGQGFNFQWPVHPHEDFLRGFDHVRDYFLNNLDWIIPVAVFALFIGLLLGLLILWLNCRGKFILLHCVALNRAEVADPWNRFGPQANSLFWFRLLLGLAGMVLILLPLVLGIVLVVRMICHGSPDVGAILAIIGLGLGIFLVAILFAIIRKFLVDFIVPLMFLRQFGCLAAWREFAGLVSVHFWSFVLYLLFQILLTMAISIVVMAVALATCCCCCFLLVPYLGTVLLLPVIVFQRSYSLYFLAQLGADFDVFAAPAMPPTP